MIVTTTAVTIGETAPPSNETAIITTATCGLWETSSVLLLGSPFSSSLSLFSSFAAGDRERRMIDHYNTPGSVSDPYVGGSGGPHMTPGDNPHYYPHN